MARTGLQIQIGSRSASLPWLPSGSCADVSKTHLHLPRALRPQKSNVELRFSICRRKVSKCGFYLGKTGCSVSPRSRLEELSTAEELGKKNSSEVFDEEAIRGSDDPSASSANAADKEDSSFNWLAQWYPVGVLKHMDKKQPHPVTILGRDLVMWWDQSGPQWQVFADACPHRLAPLSEGRINEQGHLQCSYHGWAFASSGACTLIPQAPRDVFEKRNFKRFCAVVYSSKEQQGLLWVYMDTSEGASEFAAANSPPFIPVLSDPDFVYDLAMSDLSYSYEALIENLLDPAHVPFAHHGLQGKRSLAKPLDFQVGRIEKTGFLGRKGDQQLYYFIAPSLSRMDFCLPPPSSPKGHPWALKLREFIMSKGPGGEGSTRQISTVFLCVPMTPDKSRVFFAFPRNFGKLVYDLTPRWVNHLLHMTVLDSDMYLLHLMEHRLEERRGMGKTESLYYCPTASDIFVVSYRKWLTNFGGSVPDYGSKASDRLPPSAPKTTLLDRKSLHVENCTICSGALRNFKFLDLVLQVLPLVLVGLVAVSNLRPLRVLNPFGIPLICTAVCCSLASRWLQNWTKKNYEFHDYNHALIK